MIILVMVTSALHHLWHPPLGLLWVTWVHVISLARAASRHQDVRMLRSENYVRIWCVRLPAFIACRALRRVLVRFGALRGALVGFGTLWRA